MTRPPARLVNPSPLDAPPRTPTSSTARVVNAYTSRGGSQAAGPLLHASPYPPVPYTATGSTYRALCGSQVRNVTRVAWHAHGPGRHCPACTAAAEKVLKARPAPADD